MKRSRLPAKAALFRIKLSTIPLSRSAWHFQKSCSFIPDGKLVLSHKSLNYKYKLPTRVELIWSLTRRTMVPRDRLWSSHSASQSIERVPPRPPNSMGHTSASSCKVRYVLIATVTSADLTLTFLEVLLGVSQSKSQMQIFCERRQTFILGEEQNVKAILENNRSTKAATMQQWAHCKVQCDELMLFDAPRVLSPYFKLIGLL